MTNSTAAPSATSAPTGLPPLVLTCLAATWLVWGSTYLAIKFALECFPPFFQMGTRFLTAGALLMAWMRWRGAPWPDARQWRHAFLVGALMLGGGMGCTALAETTVSSGLVVAFIAIGPLLITLMSLPFGVRPARAEATGIAVGFAGVVMLVQGQGFASSPAGLVAMLIATSSWALGSVLSQRRYPLAPGAMGFASEMLAGGLVLMAIALVRGEAPKWPPTAGALAAWVYLVVFGSLIGFNAYMVLLARTTPALASSYSFVNPVIALLLGVGLAGEVVTAFEWLSSGVIISGVVLLVLGRRASTHRAASRS